MTERTDAPDSRRKIRAAVLNLVLVPLTAWVIIKVGSNLMPLYAMIVAGLILGTALVDAVCGRRLGPKATRLLWLFTTVAIAIIYVAIVILGKLEILRLPTSVTTLELFVIAAGPSLCLIKAGILSRAQSDVHHHDS